MDRSDDPNLTTTPKADDCTSATNDRSLRGAISKSNTIITTDTIEFGIPDNPAIAGQEVRTISPTSPLPPITDNVTVDGYTQAVVNSASTNANSAVLKIQISGLRPNGSNLAASGRVIEASSCLLQGLTINRFGQHGILIRESDSDRGNGEEGVHIESADNVICGPANASQNVISGNGGTGISMLGSGAGDNTVQGNFIGTDVNGTGILGNFHGVFISDAPGNLIGGAVAEAANTIFGNLNNGVMIIGGGATGNTILRNFIFGNGSPGGLGIALNNDGVTANDPKDPDGGPNRLQNFPVMTSASTTTIEGRLNSRPGKTFTIQFFSNPSPNFPTGSGEGETFLGEKTVTTNSEGRASFTFATALTAGEVIAATDATGSTSAFSAGRFVE